MKLSDGRFFVIGDDELMVIVVVDVVLWVLEKVVAFATFESGRSGRFFVGLSGFDVDVEIVYV